MPLRADLDELQMWLENMHAPECHALREEVLVYPEYCDCNVSNARVVVHRMQRVDDVSTGEASLDVVELTFDELRNRIERLEGAAGPVVDSWPRTKREQIDRLRQVL